MIVAVIVTSIVFTNITEKRIMPHLPRYESSEEEVVINNKKLRGLIVGLAVGILYLLIIIYNIIPNLPLSGALLDTRADKYIDMLFGVNSLFNKGFIFIVTVFFMVIGFAYGFVTKNIKTSKDITESLAYSLDGIGNVLVLIFFASLFVNVYQESNIGNVIAAFGANIIGGIKFSGIALIITSLLIIAIVNVFCPNSITKWTIMSATMVPLFMNASISPEFTQIVYSAGDSITNGFTPLFMYFVIYLAFMEKYNQNDTTTLTGCSKILTPYSIFSLVIWAVILVGWFMIGVPIGIGSAPGVVYGA
jgi:aminobenzoyl-glutamate transport protein